MTKPNPSGENKNIAFEKDDTAFRVNLPVKKEDFAEFVMGVLGRPQTITSVINSPYLVNIGEISSLHHAILQRLSEQNDAQLIQFRCTISYGDATTVVINSFKDFEGYNELRPVKTYSLLVEWVMLITFYNKNYPERQEIALSFRIPGDMYKEIDDNVLSAVTDKGILFHGITIKDKIESSQIKLQILYTSRTWGNDIFNLLTTMIHSSLLIRTSRYSQFVVRHMRLIALCSMVFSMTAFLIMINTLANFIWRQIADDVALEMLNSAIDLSDMRKFFFTAITKVADLSKFSPDMMIAMSVFISSPLIFILGGIVAKNIKSLRRRSSIVLTRMDNVGVVEDEKRLKNNMWKFSFIQIISYVIGVAASITATFLMMK